MGILTSRASKETFLGLAITALASGVTVIQAGDLTVGITLVIVGLLLIALRGILKSG